MSDLFSLSGKTALVTGAGMGSGRGIAEVLAEQGARVAVNDIEDELAHLVVAEIEKSGGEAYPTVFDITDREAVRSGVQEVEDKLGPVDILVNNVGMLREPNKHDPFVETDVEDWKPWIDVNIYGSLHCLRSVLPGMVQRGWGRVVQISSPLGSRGLPNRLPLLGGAKAGIEGALRNIAMEVAGDGVTINTIAITVVSTMAWERDSDQEFVRSTLANIPIGRFLEPREVGAAAAWLASNEGAAVTGQVIHVNGGNYHGR